MFWLSGMLLAQANCCKAGSATGADACPRLP